jgi:hypothetical protein
MQEYRNSARFFVLHLFDDDEVSGTPMTIPALVHEITCCLAAYLTSARTCGKKSPSQILGTHKSKRVHSVLDSE